MEVVRTTEGMLPTTMRRIREMSTFMLRLHIAQVRAVNNAAGVACWEFSLSGANSYLVIQE
jgi:hypothetical protein